MALMDWPTSLLPVIVHWSSMFLIERYARRAR
jgi:hypothetical protein